MVSYQSRRLQKVSLELKSRSIEWSYGVVIPTQISGKRTLYNYEAAIMALRETCQSQFSVKEFYRFKLRPSNPLAYIMHFRGIRFSIEGQEMLREEALHQCVHTA